ncbi:MarR family transcriptional regulator [Leptospira sp. 85282-16]|uniref:MarR family transcriptional regulator n=1 Tax=Leptospira montravelensis TaxID=2484961 RepID=A0ABY2LTX6_9LEPT|nr:MULTISPECIES: MarR family transcriptional regulator [Leptospira]MCT8332454.1 MarR family transcriptional regulator [Leptospira sp. 85282-16]TGK83678.1 MarR family transcriptional regulator [Leptospira montravelensis]TGL05681.1 MarR family transcriptional regulator [Leptospira montravelensis]
MSRELPKRFRSVRYFDRISSEIAEIVRFEMEKLGYPGLTTSHFEILTFLLRSTVPINMTQIAKTIEKTKPTCTVLVNRLVKEGLVERNPSPSDGREWALLLSKDGKKIRKKIVTISAKLLSLQTWGITKENEDILYPILEVIYKHIRNKKEY